MLKKSLCLLLSSLVFNFPAVSVVSAQEETTVKPGIIKIADFNVDGLPVPSFLSSSKKNLFKATDDIIKFLNLQDCDLIMTQENFNLYNKYERSLNMPYISLPTGGVCVGDGLGIASKMPMYNVSHTAWNSAYGILDSGWDEMTPKGFMVSTIKLCDDVYIDVYNLHADAGEDEKSLQAKIDQFDQLSEFIETYSKDRAVIIAGDFNSNFSIVLGDKLIDSFISKGFKDTWVEMHNDGNYTPTSAELYSKYQLPYWGNYDCLDKILYRGTDSLSLEVVSHNYEFSYTTSTKGEKITASDHAACIAELKYEVLAPTQNDIELVEESEISFSKKTARFFKAITKALSLIASQIPGILSGDVKLDWAK